MRVAVVNPPRYHGTPVVREDRCEITERSSLLPPYSLIQIVACLREYGHEPLFLDANERDSTMQECRDWLDHGKPDVVLFRFTPTTFESDMIIAKISKELSPSTQTIGICHTLNPVAPEVVVAAKYLDFYLVGDDYEETLRHLLGSIGRRTDLLGIPGIAFRDESGEVRVNIEGCPRKGLDSLPLPAFDLVSGGKYHNKSAPKETYMVMATARGCPFSCGFCTVRRTSVRMKSPARVLMEIDSMVNQHGVRRLSFFDETFTLDKNRVYEICSGLIEKKYRLRWYCNTRVDCVDRNLLHAMAEAGCDGLSFGVESGSQRVLDFANKGTTVDQASDAIGWAKDAGIKVYASFVLGLPGEDATTLAETREFVNRTRPNGAQFNLAVPYPGTPLYDLARKNNWIDHDYSWLDLYQHKAHMRTADLTQADLEIARINMYKSLYLNAHWIVDNLLLLARRPQDIGIGLRYYIEGMRGLLTDRMQHRH